MRSEACSPKIAAPMRTLFHTAVDVSPVPDFYNDNNNFIISNLVDDAVIALSDTIAVIARKLLAADWSWIIG